VSQTKSRKIPTRKTLPLLFVSRRVSVSFPTSADVLPVFYNRHPSASRGSYSNPPVIPGGLYPPTSGSDASVLWPFGHGLSYSANFTYGNVSLSPAVVGAGGTVQVEFAVTNTGTRDAEEVVQVYVRQKVASVTTPVKQLRAFRRIPIAAGKTASVVFDLVVREALWLIDAGYNRVVEPGNFTIMVGGSSDAIQHTAELVVAE